MEGKWFVDIDGDLGLFVNGQYWVLYKYAIPVQLTDHIHEVTFLSDYQARKVWRDVQSSIASLEMDQ